MTGAAEREGAVGAFSKGVLSTVLATPCAGPLIGPAVGWAVRQPPSLTFAAFTCIGLGMAAPYLLVGAIPRLVNLLPKPGAWMDIFKQIMGFVLMGTVIFLFLSVPANLVVPTLILLLGIGIACWLLGITPLTAEFRTKLTAWGAGVAVVVVSAVLGFLVFVPSHGIEWQPFSRVALDQHLGNGNTVLVDFTANW
jgi:thiol:disulfide interchange protein